LTTVLNCGILANRENNKVNFNDQSEIYLKKIATRRRNPARANTLHVYRSLLNVRILPTLGREDLANVDNDTVKSLVDRLAEAHLSPSTINLAVTLVKQIVKSAVDEKGHPLQPRSWDMDFMEVPVVDSSLQKAPIVPVKALQDAVDKTSGEVKVLIALLAGTGLRVGEALALGHSGGNLWDSVAGTLTIRATMVDNQVQTSTKTKAGTRTVDLPSSLNDLMKHELGTPQGPLFTTAERTLHRRLATYSIKGFHSLRRFRITHLQGISTPIALIKFWVGHAASDVTEGYTKFGSMMEERKAWSEKAGLGFTL
jgi:integrase